MVVVELEEGQQLGLTHCSHLSDGGGRGQQTKGEEGSGGGEHTGEGGASIPLCVFV